MVKVDGRTCLGISSIKWRKLEIVFYVLYGRRGGSFRSRARALNPAERLVVFQGFF